MATFDLQHFYETRQELAMRNGSIYAQRGLARIRELVREEQVKQAREREQEAAKAKKHQLRKLTKLLKTMIKQKEETNGLLTKTISSNLWIRYTK